MLKNIRDIKMILYNEFKNRMEKHLKDLLLYSNKKKLDSNRKTLYIFINYLYKNRSYIEFYNENKKRIYRVISLEEYENIEIICKYTFNKNINFNIYFETEIFIAFVKEFKDINTIEKMLSISKIKAKDYILKNSFIRGNESPFYSLIKNIEYLDEDKNDFLIYPIKLLKINKKFNNLK